MARRKSEPTIPRVSVLNAELDQLCDAFEAAWRAGKPPTLESIVGQVVVGQQPGLFRELLHVEIAYRRKRGESLLPESLTGRFPQFSAVINTLLPPAATSVVELEAKTFVGSASQVMSVGLENGPGSLSGEASPAATDRFKALRLHAKGGLGEVFVAHDNELAREVALKEINARFANDPEARERFVREAEITGRLEHPGIVPVYGLGYHADGRPYYAMRFIQGESLQQALQNFHDADKKPQRNAGERALELRQLLQRFIAVCNAIGYAHSRGVLHRDLKPGNIMLGKFGETLVVDWGLAKIIGRMQEPEVDCETMMNLSITGDSSATRMGSVVGTLSYMSPEQAAGRVDQLAPASDVYCLGATLYCLLTGSPPFNGTVQKVLRDVEEGIFLPPRQIKKEVPAALDAVCLKAMAVRPNDRYVSAKALSDDLEHWLADEPVSAVPDSLSQRVARWTRRNRAWVQVGSMALVLLAVVSTLAAVLINNASQDRLVAVQHESDAKALAALSRSFETGLNATDWSPQQVGAQETLITEIAKYDTNSVTETKQRLYQRFAAAIESELRREKLTEATAATINVKLALLRERRSDLAIPLTSLLASRRGDWQILAALEQPYTNLGQMFSEQEVHIAESKQALFHALPNQEGAAPVVVTKVACGAAARVDAEFETSWGSTDQLGFLLQAGTSPAYEFTLSIGQRRQVADDAAPVKVARTFDLARTQQADVLVEIWREGNILRRESFPAARLPAGPLKIRCQRELAHLSLQVTGLDPIDVLDPFPLGTSAAATNVALRWPPQIQLRRLEVSQHEAALQTTEFEKADELFHAGRFEDALREYSRLAVASEEVELRHEAQAKQGLCLMKLKRVDEAAKQFETLLNQPGERWPALAGCELWLLRLRQNRDNDADVIAHLLASRFVPAQIVPLIPGDVRNEIMNHYYDDFRVGAKRVRFNPRLRQNLELYLVIDRLFSRTGEPTFQGLHAATEAYEMLDDLPQAISFSRQINKRDSNAWGVASLARLLRLNKDYPQARQELDGALANFAGRDPSGTAALFIERARLSWIKVGLDAAASDIAALEKILEQSNPQQPSLDFNVTGTGCLLCGMYHSHRGEDEAAKRLWTNGMKRMASEMQFDRYVGYRTIEHFVMLAGLSEQPDEVAVRKAVEILLSSNNPMISVGGPMIGTDKVVTMATQIWQTKRGREVALDLTLDRWAKSEAAQNSVVLVAWYAIRQAAFAGQLEAEQDQLVWEISQTTYTHIILNGKLSTPQMVQLSAAWSGITGILGWKGVADAIPPETRGPFAYVLAHRYQRLGQLADSEVMLRDAVAHSEKDSLLHRLAERELTPTPEK